MERGLSLEVSGKGDGDAVVARRSVGLSWFGRVNVRMSRLGS